MWDFVLGPCVIMQYIVSFLVCNHLDDEERAGCFTFIVFLMSSGFFSFFLFLTVPLVGLQSVNVTFPGHSYNVNGFCSRRLMSY